MWLCNMHNNRQYQTIQKQTIITVFHVIEVYSHQCSVFPVGCNIIECELWAHTNAAADVHQSAY